MKKQIKATSKKSFNIINKTLNELLKRGVNSFQENIETRGWFHRMMKAKRKNIT